MKHAVNFRNLTGKKIHRLTVLKYHGRTAAGKSGRTLWLCQCDCGVKVVKEAHHLHRGRSKSCGCFKREAASIAQTVHGHAKPNAKTSTYRSWYSMRQRCLQPKQRAYPKYGGKGIKICKRWANSFAHFLADMGERPTGTSLDRFPNWKGDYKPSNCRWATPQQQVEAYRGDNHYCAKLKAKDIPIIRSSKLPNSMLAQMYGVTRGAIYLVKHNRSWKHIE